MTEKILTPVEGSFDSITLLPRTVAPSHRYQLQLPATACFHPLPRLQRECRISEPDLHDEVIVMGLLHFVSQETVP
jgi:hypothetical protein